jgi:hypothetical protein
LPLPHPSRNQRQPHLRAKSFALYFSTGESLLQFTQTLAKAQMTAKGHMIFLCCASGLPRKVFSLGAGPVQFSYFRKNTTLPALLREFTILLNFC